MASFDLKYRPKSFRTFYGNNSVIESLKVLIENKRKFPSAILLHGDSGCGKTTLARIIPKMLKIKNVYEHNIADTRGIDDAKSIIKDLRYNPLSGRGKVIVLNECHEANKFFQDAMLEVLEEPPDSVYFILCTTEPDKLLKAIKTRCTPFCLRPLDTTQSKKLIKRVCEEEEIDLNSNQIRMIHFASEGVPRVIMNILNLITSIEDPDDINEAIENYSIEIPKEVAELCRALLKNESYKDTMKIAKTITGEPERIRRHMLNYMSAVLKNGPNKKAANVMDNLFDSWFYIGMPGLFLSLYHIMED